MARLRIGILTSEFVPGIFPETVIREAIRSAGGTAVRVRAEKPSRLESLNLLINNLGDFYHEPTFDRLFDYYQAGGAILSTGPRAFTIPFLVRDGNREDFPATDAALHTFALIDTHVPNEIPGGKIRMETTPRYAFLQDLFEEGAFPNLSESYSLDVRLATKPQKPEDLYASHGIVEARFEPCCVLKDENGRRTACPISRVDHHEKGSLLFLNFTPKDRKFPDSENAFRLLLGTIRSALSDRWDLNVRASLPRAFPEESVGILWEAFRLGPKQKPGVEIETDARLSFSLYRWDLNDSEGIPEGSEVRTDVSRKVPGERGNGSLRFDELREGRYSVKAVLSLQGIPILENWAGFYVASEKSVRALLKEVPRMEIRPEISPDYPVRDGKPMPLHGTTYMAPPLYRDCFQNMNVHVCDTQMREMREAGINVLRAGVWTGYENTFQMDGPFREEALRSLDAYFLTAARYRLPVQFVFAAFVMNHWDRSRNPIHDPVLQNRIHGMFRQFAKRYRGWPNVQVDIMNEPSYAPYRDGWMWNIARPFYDSTEQKAFAKWLKDKYGDLSRLREAWGVTAADLRSFEEAVPPTVGEFNTNYSGSEKYDGRAKVSDFCRFARESFSEWLRGIRDIVKSEDPEMLVMIGRDETLRIPAQQDDLYRGSLDLVNWHQWHREGTMFMEYMLNRVRGVPCCGQEMGILPYKDQRNDERLTEWNCRGLLERKLLYCLGNFVQWQSHNDVTMDSMKETKLGLYRADGTEKPYMDVIRLLSWMEDRMAPLLTKRKENTEDVLLLNPTSLWFSSDHPLAYRAMTSAVYALQFHMKHRAEMVLEHLLREEHAHRFGKPRLILVPSPILLMPETWETLVRMMEKQGVTVAISGGLGLDDLWRRQDYLATIGLGQHLENVATVERVRIGKGEREITYREAVRLGLPGKTFYKSVLSGAEASEVLVRKVGRGTLVYSPVPIEVGDSIEPVVDFYRLALKESSARPSPIRVEEAFPSHFIYPIEYSRCTAVTVFNEGPESKVRFAYSGVPIEMNLKKERGAKVYLSPSGKLIGGYIHAPLHVDGFEIEPNGTLAFVRSGKGFHLMPGERDRDSVILGGREITIPQGVVYSERSV